MYGYKLIIILCIGASVILNFGHTYAAEKLLVLTEQFPPFNYLEGDAIKGLSTKIVKELLGRAQLDYRLELVPWKRAYTTALKRPNTIIFTIAKTESRKDSFHWIGKISNRKVSLFRLRSRQDLAAMTIEAAKKKAKIATVQDDASTESIIEMGFALKNITAIRDVTTGSLCIKHVMKGRSDYFPMNPFTVKYRIETGDIQDLFTDQFVVHDDDGYYIAANLEIDQEILQTLRSEYNGLVKEGFIEGLISEYLNF